MLHGGSKSFSTVGSSNWGYISWNFLSNSTTATNTSLNSNAWEWEFDYKNTTGKFTYNPDSVLVPNGASSCGMVAGKDSWKYWLLANGYSGNSTLGLYVTQVAGTLRVVYKYSPAANGTQTYLTMPMPNNNHTYQIRIVRSVIGYWNFYIYDRTTSTLTTSLDLPNQGKGVNINLGNLANYNLSYLEATSAAADRFEWDNFNFYQVRLDYVPVTGNGISNPIYPGMGTALIYGIGLSLRGDIIMGRLVFNYTADITKLFGTNANAKLYEKASLPLAVTGATLLNSSYILQNNGTTNQIDLTSLNKRYYAGGNTDGSTANAAYYFLTTTALTTFTSGYPTSVTYSVSTSNNDNFTQFFASTAPYTANSSSSVSIPSSGGDVWDWTGSQTNWTAAGAWKKNKVSTSTSIGPSITSDIVRIGVEKYSGGTNQPPISSTTATVASVEFGKFGSNSSSPSAITLTLGSSGLTVNTGVTLDSLANVIIAGPAGSKLTLGTGSKSTVASTATLTVGSNLTLTNNGTLTLQSDASGTASIAEIPSSSTIDGSGSVIAQRYIPGGPAASTRKYRLLSSPVSQYAGTPNQYDFQNLKLNSLVSGANPTVNGFDVSNLNNPSIYTYNETAISPYSAATAITQKVNVGTGFYFYFRGNRTSPSSTGNKYVKPYIDPENTTETWIGTVNSGTITVPVTYTVRYTGTHVYNTNNGFNLVGNPYPSAIDLNAITLSSECSKIVYEYNYRTGNFDTYDIDNNIGSDPDNPNLRYIASGQGFFIKMNDPAGFPDAGTTVQGTVTFTESAKSTVNNTSIHLLMGAKPKNDILPVLHIKVVMDSTNADNTAIFFKDGYSAAYDGNDAIRFGSIESRVSLASISSDKQNMIMNFMPAVSDVKSVKLSVAGSTNGLYTLNFSSAETIDKRFGIWLKDNYKKDSLDIRNNSSYAFNINRTDTASFGSNRFEIVFHEDIPVYTMRSFTGEKNSLGAKLTWLTSNEADYTGFTLEKQDNNAQFQPIYFIQSDGSSTYSYTDTKTNTGNNYYRLKQDDVNGKITYSNTVNLIYELSHADKNTFIVYPNPAISTLHTSSATITEACRMIIFNANGTKLLDKNVDNGGNITQYIGNYLPGTYIIQLVSLKNGKVLGITKFSKN